MLIIGLGNPGPCYAKTRHNAGQLMVAWLKEDKAFAAKHRLVKSNVWMNETGAWVKKLIQKEKVALDELVIVHDDLDIPLGEFRRQKSRGSAGHRGIESLLTALESNDFWRIRLGIGLPPAKVEGEEYVLQQLEKQELKLIKGLTDHVRDSLSEISPPNFR